MGTDPRGTTITTNGEDPSPLPTNRRRGRPRDPSLDIAIVVAAQRHLAERGYSAMSLEAVAADAGTTVPSLRRRFPSKADLATAAIAELRVSVAIAATPSARADAVAVLVTLRSSLLRPRAMATLGTVLAEEERQPDLLRLFHDRLVVPRRAALSGILARAIVAGELDPATDVEALVNLLVGSLYETYVATGDIAPEWPERVVAVAWPESPS
ncbi:MAG TPA: TetR/AcrR family transcriptional regulator [Acidimicrobiales bacterium]|nr:TetR/AcrR family transcriptional regulator [Acidimicrobiales bacterium]